MPRYQRAPLKVAARKRATPAPSEDERRAVQRPAPIGNRAIARIVDSVRRREADGEELPERIRAGVEGLSGYALDDVRVHRGSNRADALGAYAFTKGSDIHVADGGDEHLAHEAWHVVQQKGGRVPADSERDGTPVNEDDALEHEADAMGARALTAAPASREGLKSVAAAPVAAQLKCKLCGAKSHSESKCPKAEKKDTGEEKSGGRGLLKAGKKEKDLFELILPKLDHESMYGPGAKSLVGGYKGKSNGLKDNSIRIDRQGLGNVQFQIGDDSYACAIFEQDTEPDAIIAALRKSLNSGKNEEA